MRETDRQQQSSAQSLSDDTIDTFPLQEPPPKDHLQKCLWVLTDSLLLSRLSWKTPWLGLEVYLGLIWSKMRRHQKLPKALSNSSTLWPSTIVRIISTNHRITAQKRHVHLSSFYVYLLPCCFLFATLFAFGGVKLHRPLRAR